MAIFKIRALKFFLTFSDNMKNGLKETIENDLSSNSSLLEVSWPNDLFQSKWVLLF